MGTMDWHSPHSPPSFTGPSQAAGDTTASSSSSPENVNVNGNSTKPANGLVFPPRPFLSNASDSSSADDDSSRGTLAGASSVNNDSDCESIETNPSRTTMRRVSSAVPSLCSSGGASVSSSIERIDEVVPSNVDKLLLGELQELSSTDRCKVQEEIHGVSTCAIEEDEEKVIKGLLSLEEQIRAIRREVLLGADRLSSDGRSYDEAMWACLGVDEESAAGPSLNNEKRMLYSYIFHKDFRLKFLRADLYDARKAAHRYLRCLECLLKYYGSYALQRPLMYEDLGKECQDAAKTGFVQILPSRDRAGRLVVVCQPTTKATSMSTIVKLFTYVFQVVSEDIETQKRGAIFVFSTDDDALQLLSDPVAKREYNLYREGSMIRRSCTHFCLPENNPKMAIVRSVMMLAMSSEERVRTRIHMDGLTTETQYKLMTFGIPVTEFPITSTGATKTKHHNQWTKTRKAIDAARMKSLEQCYNRKLKLQHGHEQQQLPNSYAMHCTDFCPFPPTYDEFLQQHGKEPIIYPMINDVLFSKGGKNVTHYGNIEFTDLMKRSLLAYVSGSSMAVTPLQNRKRRKEIRQQIIDQIQAKGGRFLTLDKKLPGGYCWIEIEKGPDLHDRIATSLYDHKRRLAAKLKAKSHRSDTSMFTGIDNSKRRKVTTDDRQPIPDGSMRDDE